jgi:hypothetical protein
VGRADFGTLSFTHWACHEFRVQRQFMP